MFFGRKQKADKAAGPDTAGARANGHTATAAPSALANGASNGGPAQQNPDQVQGRTAAAKRLAASFGEIVALLMQSPSDKHHTLADLEWLVVPAVARGQFALAEAHAKDTGATGPVAAVLWALVSPDVDQRLSDLATPLRLKPDEWRSGDIPWIVLGTGDARVLSGLMQQLITSVFKTTQPKMRLRDRDGKTTVAHLDIKEKAPATV